MRNLLLIALIVLPFISQAQKAFEGTINYKIEYLVIPEDMKEMSEMLPKELLVTISGDKSRTEQRSQNGETQIILGDLVANESVVLMDFMGRKIALQSEDMFGKSGNQNEIAYLKGKKTIADYKCKYAEISNGKNDQATEVYYFPKLSNYKIHFLGLKGLPLEYTVYSGGFKIRYTAVSMVSESPASNSFVIPDNYEKMTQQQFEESIMKLN